MSFLAVLGLSPTTTVILCGLTMTCTLVWYHFTTVKWDKMPGARSELWSVQIEKMIRNKTSQVHAAVENGQINERVIAEFK